MIALYMICMLRDKVWLVLDLFVSRQFWSQIQTHYFPATIQRGGRRITISSSFSIVALGEEKAIRVREDKAFKKREWNQNKDIAEEEIIDSSPSVVQSVSSAFEKVGIGNWVWNSNNGNALEAAREYLHNRFNADYNVYEIAARVRCLRNRFTVFDHMINCSGVNWARRSNKVFVPKDLWQSWKEDYPMSRAYMFQGEPLYNELSSLFARPIAYPGQDVVVIPDSDEEVEELPDIIFIPPPAAIRPPPAPVDAHIEVGDDNNESSEEIVESPISRPSNERNRAPSTARWRPWPSNSFNHEEEGPSSSTSSCSPLKGRHLFK
ncbi:hypothetical protein ACS0TY_029223 [Phlomoides rotata]